MDQIPAKCNIQPYEWKADLVNHTLTKQPPEPEVMTILVEVNAVLERCNTVVLNVYRIGLDGWISGWGLT